MMKYNTVLFDLDGTLTDPKEGITRCVAYALEHFGIHVEDTDTLCPFIGPPLYECFEKFYHLTHEEAEKAVEIYRERFRPIGMFENEVYEGIPALLADLKTAGITVALATSKPQEFALKILEHFDLLRYFDIVVGSELSGARIEKQDVIREVIAQLTSARREPIIMVGDRCFDVEGAAAEGIPCIGVLYGYGNREELKNAVGIAATVKELREMLL